MPNLVTRPDPPSFKRSDLRDPEFFAAHRKDILSAVVEGRILDDMPEWRNNRPTTSAQRSEALARKAATNGGTR